MSGQAFKSQGALFQVRTSASPEVYTTVAGITDIPSIRNNKAAVEVTSIEDVHDAFIHGHGESLDIALSGNYDPDDAGQIAVRALLSSEAAENLRIVLTDSPATILQASCKVFGWEVSNPAKDRAMWGFTIKNMEPWAVV